MGTAMKNPFTFSELATGEGFCNRETELEELSSHALNKANVVLYSPRRYGKTSLVKRVQADLAKKGVITLYMDFFGVDSVGDIVEQIVSSFYKYCHLHKKTKWFFSGLRPVMTIDPREGSPSFTIEPSDKRRGIDLLRETIEEFGKVTRAHKEGFHVVFDEFQELTEIPEARQIEGVMRSSVQTHSNVSYFFVGSRRRILLAMFNERKRPFFQSAVNYALGPLPEEQAAHFIVERFKAGGKKCPPDIARAIVTSVGGYPFYIQRIPYSMYEVSESNVVSPDDYRRGLARALEEQKAYYESLLMPLSIQQKRLLTAIASEPTANPFSVKYMFNHNLGSYGGIQGALKKLLNLDYVEKRADGRYFVVDPVFAKWQGQWG
jgi:AAA+ ATPase superfamily predicted ATPase